MTVDYDPAQDLVLTCDLALRLIVEKTGGVCAYLDHLCEQMEMQKNNFLIYQFFRDWHFDAAGSDIFTYKNIGFGFRFRIDIWNDFTFYVRLRLCLERLRQISHQALFVGLSNGPVKHVIDEMNLDGKILPRSQFVPQPVYFFPIHEWIDQRLHTKTMRHFVRDTVTVLQGYVMGGWDRITGSLKKRTGVFVQEYYPTRKILQSLLQQRRISVVQAHFSSAQGVTKFLRERPIPVYGSAEKYRPTAKLLMENFRRVRSAKLILSNGIDITNAVNHIIEQRIADILPEVLRDLDCVIRHLEKNPLKLIVLAGNLGQLAMLVDAVAKHQGIPSYLIINGLLGNEFHDEGKYATVINSYSTSIRDNYFRGMQNIVCLGDPRMDDYAASEKKLINRTTPTITISASGFNNIDLNSYLAVEFDFLNDVLQALAILRQRGLDTHVIIKVRSNGYKLQYCNFVEEYYPGVVNEIIDNAPIREILDRTDFLISIYSQTLFEASCLGIPSVYYRKDNEIIDPPFDGQSELVTISDVPSLVTAIEDFQQNHERYNDFLKKSMMEKYVGRLDGKNLKRNLDYIDHLLAHRSKANPAEQYRPN